MSGRDRERGILSEADRSYLRGGTEYASIQSERNARARIRDRVYEGVRDFELLVGALPAEDRKLVFEKRFAELDGVEAFDALVSAVAFLYLAVGDTDLEFDRVLHEAVNVAEARSNRAATVDLDVTYHSLSAAELRRKLKRGEELSLTEIAYLQRSDDVGADELARYFEGVAEAAAKLDDGRIQSKVTDF